MACTDKCINLSVQAIFWKIVYLSVLTLTVNLPFTLTFTFPLLDQPALKIHLSGY